MTAVLSFLATLAPLYGFWIALGSFMDIFAGDRAKKLVTDRLSGSHEPVPNIHDVLIAFLDSTVLRIFGHRPLSVSFLKRSVAFSFVILVFLALVQLGLYGSTMDLWTGIFVLLGFSWFPLLICVLVNLCVDWCSAITTVSLARMAARTRTKLDLLIAVVADLALTVTVFTLLFPFALMAFANFQSSQVGVVDVEILDLASRHTDGARCIDPTIDSLPGFEGAGCYELSFRLIGEGRPPSPPIIEALILNEEDRDSVSEVIAQAVLPGAFTNLAIQDGEEAFPLSGHLDLGWTNLSVDDQFTLYSLSYSASNILREGFVFALMLDPRLQVGWWDLRNAWARTKQIGLANFQDKVICDDGQTKVVTGLRSAELIEVNQSCDVGAILRLHSPFVAAQYLSLNDTPALRMPLAIFFASSFGVTILIYLMFIFFYFARFLHWSVGWAVNLEYVKVDNAPMTAVSLVIAVFLTPFWLMARLF